MGGSIRSYDYLFAIEPLPPKTHARKTYTRTTILAEARQNANHLQTICKPANENGKLQIRQQKRQQDAMDAILHPARSPNPKAQRTLPWGDARINVLPADVLRSDFEFALEGPAKESPQT